MADKSVIDHYRELHDSLKVEVKIDHNEVLKVVVRDLINKYNSWSCESNKDNQKAFEIVLKYYLGDEDFIKYVIKGVPID